jgi:Family of unknown function (DUF6298)/Putative collagen-binding domain of a collagenase
MAAPASGPLRPLKNNPRYFTDGSGRAIYLAGSHNWHNFQDNGHRFPQSQDPPPKFDYDAYLDFLVAHHHNFFRLWRWEAPKWADAQPNGMIKYSEPHPWMRTGPGIASDGKPKFDLLKFNPDYFDRMRARIIAARERGIYVSVMLFEGWELQFTDAWKYHPFNRANNINGVDADVNDDGKGVEFDTLEISQMGKRVLALQESYLRHVVDTVDDLDNLLYEVCNEAAGSSTPWQYHVIEYIHEYEASKPKQHPVGMTFQYANGANALLYNSPADWVSPNPGDPEERYRDNPWPARAGKVIVNDTDHLWGHTGGDNVWVWKSFTRGLNVLFMEELLPSPTWQDSAREAMGQTRMFADRMNLAEMTLSREISNTGYCLANRGTEYLVFQSDRGEFTVNLSDAAGPFSVEWFNTTNGATEPGKQVAGGAVHTFTTPFGGPAALYLKLASPQ